MRKLKSFAFAMVSATLITACSNSADQEIEISPAQTLYEQSQYYLKDGNYTKAIDYLNALNTRFSLTAYNKQALLDLMYAYYQSGTEEGYDKVILTTEKFLNKYPPNDYVYYISGLTNMAQNNNFAQDLFHIDPANRDSHRMEVAFYNFKSLVEHFPNSPYTPDVLQRMAYIKAMLARHELNVAEFYAKRHAYVAVSNRIVEMLKKYPDTEATFEALPLLKKSYEKMGLTKLANKTALLIEANKNKKPTPVEKPGEPQSYIPPVDKNI